MVDFRQNKECAATQLALLSESNLTEGEQDVVRRHLAECEKCLGFACLHDIDLSKRCGYTGRIVLPVTVDFNHGVEIPLSRKELQDFRVFNDYCIVHNQPMISVYRTKGFSLLVWSMGTVSSYDIGLTVQATKYLGDFLDDLMSKQKCVQGIWSRSDYGVFKVVRKMEFECIAFLHTLLFDPKNWRVDYYEPTEPLLVALAEKWLKEEQNATQIRMGLVNRGE